MMRAGIAMRDADQTELGMYLKVLAHMSREDNERETPQSPRGGPAKTVVELRRGTADEFFG